LIVHLRFFPARLFRRSGRSVKKREPWGKGSFIRTHFNRGLLVRELYDLEVVDLLQEVRVTNLRPPLVAVQFDGLLLRDQAVVRVTRLHYGQDSLRLSEVRIGRQVSCRD